MDGTPTLRMNEFMLASLALKKIDLGAPRTPQTGTSLPAPVELVFNINEEVKGLITAAEQRFDELVGQHDLHVSTGVLGHGRRHITDILIGPAL